MARDKKQLPALGEWEQTDHAHLGCRCGHRVRLNVSDLVARYGAQATSDDVRRKAVCGACGAKGGHALVFSPVCASLIQIGAVVGPRLG